MKLKILLVAALFAVPTLATAEKISLDAAERICAERALRFSETIRGRDADLPDPMMVQDYYRSCVHAKSGSNPRGKLFLNGRVLFNLNKILGL